MAEFSWSDLAPELTDIVFDHFIFRRSISSQDLVRCSRVCTAWRSIIGNSWGQTSSLLGSANKKIDKRIRKEYLNFEKDPPKGCKVRLVDSLFHWEAIMIGPQNSPYAGGVFLLNIQFSDNHPFRPPNVEFQTKVYHPNISSDGKICLLETEWSPAISISQVLHTIYARFSDPDPDDPLDHNIADIYKTQRTKYTEEARAWTKKCATASQEKVMRELS